MNAVAKHLLWMTALMLPAAGAAMERPDGKPSLDLGPLMDSSALVLSPRSLGGLLRDPARMDWEPAVNEEQERGGADLYAKVAPSVVVVRTQSGHGTGFLLDADGTVMTNHHVVSYGVHHDPEANASYALVHLGQVDEEGNMVLDEEPVRAYFIKADPVADLALLKIDIDSRDHVAHLKLADKSPPPGSDISIIGHPASGMLWTVRSGTVSSYGRMPKDLVDAVLIRLSATVDRNEILEELERMPSRRIMLSSAHANPGDSGGPVVDKEGHLVAVTFAIPSDPMLKSFSYHVHLEEVRAFLAEVPYKPSFMIPDPWDIGVYAELIDLNDDGIPDLLMSGNHGPEFLLYDLDNSTPESEWQDLEGMIQRKSWDFEVAVRLSWDEDFSVVFYDTNNDSAIDRIHIVDDHDHSETSWFYRDPGGDWRVELGVEREFISGEFLMDSELAMRFDEFFDD